MAVSPIDVARWTSLDATISTMRESVQATAAGPEEVLHLAALMLERGDAPAAIEMLQQHEPAADSDQRESWRQLVVSAGLRLIGSRADDSSTRPASLLADDIERVRWAWQTLVSLADAEPAALIDAALGLFDLEAERYFVELDAGARRVRLDRAVQALLVSTSPD